MAVYRPVTTEEVGFLFIAAVAGIGGAPGVAGRICTPFLLPLLFC